MEKILSNIKTGSKFADRLFEIRHNPTFALPVRAESKQIINDIMALLFPHFAERQFHSSKEIFAEITLLSGRLERLLKPLLTKEIQAEFVVEKFFEKLPKIHENLWLDAQAIANGDPACENIDEVILTYPGFLAIAIFRIAHEFYEMKVPVFPRVLTEYAHQLTGIDIHPGAKIGKSFFIDHGTGVVVGETTIIGDNVKLYQGITLGALSVDKSLSNTKRHPTLEDDVVIYSGATILGGETVIGKGSVIGGNVWLTESVPPYSIVYHKSQIKVRNTKEEREEPINFVI